MQVVNVGEMASAFTGLQLDSHYVELLKTDPNVVEDVIRKMTFESPAIRVTRVAMARYVELYFFPGVTGNSPLTDIDALLNQLQFFFYERGTQLRRFMRLLTLLERQNFELMLKKTPDAECLPLAQAFLGACVTRYFSPEFQPDVDGLTAHEYQSTLVKMSDYLGVYEGRV